MIEDGLGGWCCNAENQCVTAKPGEEGRPKEPRNNEKAQCSTHGKQRGMSNLQDDGMGGYTCRPDSQCQTGLNSSGGKGGKDGSGRLSGEYGQMYDMMQQM